MVHAHGGPIDIIENPNKYLKLTQNKWAIPAPCDGFVDAINTREIGMAVVGLKGGRIHPDQKIDHAVGLDKITPLGTKVKKGDPLGLVFARSEDEANKAIQQVQNAIKIGNTAPKPQAPIIDIMRFEQFIKSGDK